MTASVAQVAGLANLSRAGEPDLRQLLAFAAGGLLAAGAVASLVRFRTRASG